MLEKYWKTHHNVDSWDFESCSKIFIPFTMPKKGRGKGLQKNTKNSQYLKRYKEKDSPEKSRSYPVPGESNGSKKVFIIEYPTYVVSPDSVPGPFH